MQISLDRTRYLRMGEVYYVAYKSFDKSSKPGTSIWLLILQYIFRKLISALTSNLKYQFFVQDTITSLVNIPNM